MSRGHTLNLGKLTEFIGGRGFDTHILKTIGQVVATTMNRRIRIGSGGKTVDGELIDPNSPGWEEAKVRSGHSPEPLVMTGQMTEPDAWEVKIGSEMTIELTLSSEHHEKWDNIMEIALSTGRNWTEVWGIGELERAAAMDALARELDKALNIK
jgi:hypothetical protein